MGNVQRQLAECRARILQSVAASKALRDERIAALDWCRANGNPHLKDKPHDPL